MAPKFAQTPKLGAKTLEVGDAGTYHALLTGEDVAGTTVEWLRAHLGEGGDLSMDVSVYVRLVSDPTQRVKLDAFTIAADDAAASTLRRYEAIVLPDGWELVVSVPAASDLAGYLTIAAGGAVLG